MNQIRIGIDFDNTIVCYHKIFHKYALKKKWINSSTPISKNEVRNTIRQNIGNDAWIELQALVYSDAMEEAILADGFTDFFNWCQKSGIPIFIISHKTQYAALGPERDLRKPAIEWLKNRGFLSDGVLNFQIGSNIFFEETREGKLERIKQCQLSHFIDDLPEVLLDPKFPEAVSRIYYNPARLNSSTGKVASFTNWHEILQHFNSMIRKDSSCDWNGFFESNLGETVESQKLIISGTNSQAFKILTKTGQVYFTKLYNFKPSDHRKPWLNEFSSLRFLWEQGVRNIPKPIVLDPEKRISTFSYIDGEHFCPEKISEKHLDQVLEFLSKLQLFKEQAIRQEIPNASEACFSLNEHFAIIEGRLQKLCASKELIFQEWLFHELLPGWNNIRKYVEQETSRHHFSFDSALAQNARVLSPSDVGFHNILKERSSGQLFFIDFEYFGFDDPVKMMCDFMLEPALPLPSTLRFLWVQKFADSFHLTDEDLFRYQLLYLIISFKWCLILLNVFAQGPLVRANGSQESMLKTQLTKSKKLYDQLQKELMFTI